MLQLFLDLVDFGDAGDLGLPGPFLAGGGGVIKPFFSSTTKPSLMSLLKVGLPMWMVRPVSSFTIRPLHRREFRSMTVTK